jgi:hypothetical protein
LEGQLDLLENSHFYVENIKKHVFKQNQITPIGIFDNEEHYFYYLELSQKHFQRLNIKFENSIVKLKSSEKLNQFLKKNKNSFSYSLCNKYLELEINTFPKDISSVHIGIFQKVLKITLIINITCLQINVLLPASVALKVGSLIGLGILSNISTTLFTLMLYFKDILDAPHMVRKKLSPTVNKYLSILTPFDCKDGVSIGSDEQAHDSYKEREQAFISEDNSRVYDPKEKETFSSRNSEFVKNLSSCRGILLISDFIIIIITIFLIILFFILAIINMLFLKNKPFLRKLYNFLLKSLLYLVMLVYFDNWLYLINDLRFLKIKLFGEKDLLLVIFRGIYVVIPLIYYYFEEQNESISKQKKKRKILKKEKKSKKKNLHFF